MKNKGSKPTWIILILVVILALFLSLIGFITDYLWFKELGYVSVFFKQLFTQLEIGIPTFAVVTLLAYVYLKLIKKGYYKKVESNDITNEKALNKITWAMAAAFSVIVSFMVVNQLWFEILKFMNSTDFNLADPLFNIDISFYVFKLAFITQLNQLIIGGIIAFIVLTFIYYTTLISMRKPQMFETVEEAEAGYEEQRYTGQNDGPIPQNPFDAIFGNFGKIFNGKVNVHKPQRKKKQFDDENFMQLVSIASKQLIALGVIFFLMLGVNFFLKQYSLLYSHTGVLYGAGYTDVNVTLWVFRALAVLSVISAITFAIGITKRKFKTMLVVPAIMIVIGIVGTGASVLVQNLVVSPDEINKESQYLERNITYTQHAYDLSDVDIKSFLANNTLTKEDIENNIETISNIRINDYEPVEKFYNQTQSIRQYYCFNNVDVDRYMVNGEYTQTFLSAREIDEAKIREEWLNKHLKYTHGYGITLSRVDKVTVSGQPDMMIHSIPPVSDVEEIKIDRPEIYFGESTNNYILTNTDEKEFDYPDGENNTYTTYEGNAGIKLSPINRMMFAIRQQSLKLLVSTNLNSNSKIIINRNIIDRVQHIMPYLNYDNDPYVVTADGGVYWIIDAYTTSTNFPYSEPYNNETRTNYIRNSVKVVIDAYNGTTSYYVVDDKDPIAATFKNIYPDLFKDFSEMPESLRLHVRYPNAMFNIQANVYKRYHMDDVNVFYQGEDLWDISSEIYGTTETVMTPNYYIMKLPGEQNAEFVNSIPYTPKDKKNMTGLLVARNDGENYGNLVLYQLPKSKIIYGPMQIEAQIDQSTEISKEFSLWNSSGSTYTRGNMFVIPIEESVLYVEPVYLEATNSSIPEVKRVIVAYGDKIAYEKTLTEALDSLFGSGSGTAVSDDGTVSIDGNNVILTQEEIIMRAAKAFDLGQTALQSGNWIEYGKQQEDLEKYLKLLSHGDSVLEENTEEVQQELSEEVQTEVEAE